MVSLECATWELTYYCLSLQFTVRDGWVKVSDSQNFWRGKDVYYQFCPEIYGLQEQMGDTDFSENEWTFGYCIQISKDLDTIYKSLKIFIQFFIGYLNTCTWCGIQAVICSWLYELLMSLSSLFAPWYVELCQISKVETRKTCIVFPGVTFWGHFLMYCFPSGNILRTFFNVLFSQG